jgi:hypothetical protein
MIEKFEKDRIYKDEIFDVIFKVTAITDDLVFCQNIFSTTRWSYGRSNTEYIQQWVTLIG